MTRKFNKWFPFTTFKIWEPRFHDKVVMLDAEKVDKAKTDYLRVVFTGVPGKKLTPYMLEIMKHDWYISKRKAHEYSKGTNGSIMCRQVPMDELEKLVIDDKSMTEVW